MSELIPAYPRLTSVGPSLAGGGGGVAAGLLGPPSVHLVRRAQAVQVATVLGVVDVVLEKHLAAEEHVLVSWRG